VVIETGSSKLEIYNIDNPKLAVSLAEITTDISPKMAEVDGNIVYVICNFSNSLQQFDLTDPAHPLLVKTVSTSNGPLGLAISNGTIGVVGTSQNLDLYEKTTLKKYTSSLGLSSAKATCTFYQNYLLVTDRDSAKLQIVNISDISKASVEYNVTTSQLPEQVYIINKVAYIASLTNPPVMGSVDAFDINDISRVTFIKSIPVISPGTGFISATGNALYVDTHFSPYSLYVIQIP
jgi:hypothetical protein